MAELQRSTSAAAATARTATQLATLQLQATRGGYRVLPARVTAIGPDGGFDWTVTLDAGSADGIKVDQTVIAGADLVGRVISVSSSSATVLLAADPGSGVGVRDGRTGQVGVVTGHGTSGFTFTGLDPNVLPKKGDVLVSGPSGASTYVAGLTVGTVTSVALGLNGSIVATVTPAISPTTVDLVGVVLVGGRTVPRPAVTPSGPAASGQAQGSR